jgi:hypothetical protein
VSQAGLVRCWGVLPASNLSHDPGLTPAVVGAVAANLPAALLAFSSAAKRVSELGALAVSGPSQRTGVRQVAGLPIRPHMAHERERRGRLQLVVPGSSGAGVPAVMLGLFLLGGKIAGTYGAPDAAA